MRLSKGISIACLLLLLFSTAYLDEQTMRMIPVSTFPEMQDTSLEVNSEQANNLHMELEYKLINIDAIDGYQVETYREYEIYTDIRGEIIKEVPTNNLDYIRYKLK
ncbi:hypothetical protein EJF36_00105 [Bacillus sp. HMF5848]|uniref:hypothetical protein n=1 Tax=Bacillus sp. HMF5848 TaxID=2495421 RepID=UPI000F793C4C|nr:hypothetical protein [Bacillus sp. HMF5848]RSK25448.1 hypothetical protein EJF36_00105 [Bacillus sp. HMF5848]